jgi:serine/threonine-protein kinase
MGRMDPGTVLARRYCVRRLLHRCTIGEVFLAERLDDGVEVEIKLIGADGRLRREASAAAAIQSEHVQRVIDVDEDAERGLVLVYERLHGESLLERLKRTGPMPLAELHPLIAEAWLGLEDIHAGGVVHRDVKPDNVFLRAQGSPQVKLRGLDVCKLAGSEETTEMGMSLGAFSFMAPEQIGKSKRADHRVDVYACATLIYQALTGQLPYKERNVLVMVEMKTKIDARKLAEAMRGPVDPRLEAFLGRGLARDPSRRFPTAREAFEAWRELCPPELLN